MWPYVFDHMKFVYLGFFICAIYSTWNIDKQFLLINYIIHQVLFMYHIFNSIVTDAQLRILHTYVKASQTGTKSKRCLVSSVVCYFNDG